MLDERLDEISLIALAELIDDQTLLIASELLVRLEVLRLNETIEQTFDVPLAEGFRGDLQLAHGSSPFVRPSIGHFFFNVNS